MIQLTNYKFFVRIKEAFQSAATNPVTALTLYCWHFIKDGVKEFWELATENLSYNDMEHRAIFFIGVITALVSMAIIWPSTIWLIILIPVAFIQNMFFTLVSRSRNSQDTEYHRYCAWGSNGVWFLCQIMIVKNIWSAINAGQWWYAILAGVVYALATTEGSVLMMKRLIKSESGKRRVGANDKVDGLESRVQILERELLAGRNTLPVAPPSKIGPAVKFDGTDDYIELPSPTKIEIKKINCEFD